MNLVAKPIIQNQFWIVTDGEKKVGNIEANNSGYGVKLNGTFLQFTNTSDLENQTHIRFESIESSNKNTNVFSTYPTTNKVYNSLLDVKRGLHLYTKTKKSKCQHAAGWFVFDQNGIQTISFCPKYIFVQRYPYEGPFKTEDEAKNVINT